MPWQWGEEQEKAFEGLKTAFTTAPILQIPNDETQTAFLRKRVILRGLEGPPIYLDDDLTKMQVTHRRACMPRVHQARKEGKRAFYRDSRVIINGKAIA